MPLSLSLSLSLSAISSLGGQHRTNAKSLGEEEGRRRACRGSLRCTCHSSSSLQTAATATATAKLQKSSGRRNNNREARHSLACCGALLPISRTPMNETVLSETKAKGPGGGAASSSQQTIRLSPLEVAECCCCGFREECTPGYARRVRERHGGRWACSLCEEAIKETMAAVAGGLGREAAKLEEALSRYSKLCKRCQSPVPPGHSVVELIDRLKHLLLRILDAQRREGGG
ncbi:uncharacterized protein LOC115746726 [Rhodamnia argentea]|uniref:Uncharacterized protein LOC115746726 n=1 Tax=Rhodamnia argentea TaxID=178133 RepID=A0ABM3H9Z7_9MYRT|nr:uncharacterized protein LOC115746726 [Rhodamnia argentea]